MWGRRCEGGYAYRWEEMGTGADRGRIKDERMELIFMTGWSRSITEDFFMEDIDIKVGRFFSYLKNLLSLCWKKSRHVIFVIVFLRMLWMYFV